MALCSAAAVGRVLANTTVSDNFNDNSTNPALWTIGHLGTGPTIAEQNGRVEVDIPANSQGSPFAASYLTQFAVGGDFDAQVDFSLLNWPSNSGVRFGIGLNVDHIAVERTSLAINDYAGFSGEFYLSDFLGLVGSVPTSDQSGKLRMTRSGNVFSGYYWNGQNWVLMGQGTGPTADANFSIAVWGLDPIFADKEVNLAFDNFQLTMTGGNFVTPVPENSSTFTCLALALGSVMIVGVFPLRRRL